MAALIYNGVTIPVALTLSIDAGNKPGADLKIDNGMRQVVVALDNSELMRLASNLMTDPRFGIDTRKWNKKDREALDEQLGQFMREQGL